MTIDRMSKKEFLELPIIERGPYEHGITGVVIIPLRTLHDSGYRELFFVPCKNCTPIGIIKSHSDVVHINGVWGLNNFINPKQGKVAWSIDYLRVSGFARLFVVSPNTELCFDDHSYSDFNIYTRTFIEKAGGK